jgi:hypothetical protein
VLVCGDGSDLFHVCEVISFLFVSAVFLLSFSYVRT